jgi:hypothetical protein
MKKVIYFLVALLVYFLGANAQTSTKYTINGYVKDSLNGESFISAVVKVKEMPLVGAYTNAYGYYSITLPKGIYNITYTYLGFETKNRIVDLTENKNLNIELAKKTYTAKQVSVNYKRSNETVQNTQMGKIELSTEKIKTLPAIFGEVDILKILQTLPGVQSAGEGQTGFYVRGGGPDQNLVLLDNANVYNTGHLFGFFSVFNPDAIKSVSLIKGGMPAQYGGRLSSVVDVNMKEGNMKKFSGSGGIGLIASRFTIEGPIKKDTSSFIISARRTYIDALAKPFIKSTSPLNGSGYYFYDLNVKVNYKLSDKDRLFLSGYFGRDVFNFKSPAGSLKLNMPWGNATGTARWNHLFNPKLFVNTSLIYNDYKFKITVGQNNFSFGLGSSIKDMNGKVDFDYYPNTKHAVKFGLNYIYHQFNPSALEVKSGDLNIEPTDQFKKYAHEAALYIADDWEVSKKIKLNIGMRYSAYAHVGPYTQVSLDNNAQPNDTIKNYVEKELVKLYAGPNGLEPRATIRYELNNSSSIKAAYSHNNQFVHLVSSNGTTLPTDIWVPSTARVKPQISDQYAIGYFKNFNNNNYETSVEIYYKKMKNQIEYREFYVPLIVSEVENDFIYGSGESYGVELFINKQFGKLSGWVGYTLAFTNRIFPTLNNGQQYPAKFDRRHDINIVSSYDLNSRWKLGGTWVFASGNVVTVPNSLYAIENTLVQNFSKVNGFRLPPYHRMDLSATYTHKHKRARKIQGSWTFSVYNVYSRWNSYIIYIYSEGNVTEGTSKVGARNISLFPKPLPSITWNFKF